MTPHKAVLQLMLTPGLGSKTLSTLLLQLASEQSDPEDVVMLPFTELVRLYKLRPEVASAIEQVREQATAIADLLDEHGIYVLTVGSDEYPQRLSETLGRDAPPVLFARGNLDILAQPAVGMSGSRHVSSAGLEATKASAELLAVAGINVVSGYANGVDLVAHQTALETGGTTTFVLAEGILNFRAKSGIREHLNKSSFVVVSEFSPSLRWIARNAMQRNRTIIGLSNALLIVEAGLDGGTYAAGEEAIKRHSKLFVLRYSDPQLTPVGNQTLIHTGGQEVRVDQDGQIALGDVLDYAVSPSNQANPATLRQDTLF